ncbi:MAG: chromate efflux transporter [Pseudomonadota bacterium]
MTDTAMQQDEAAPRGSVGEVFGAMLRLGLTSFGGPVAHLGFFRDDLVARRKWLSEAQYAELVAICQFLPGPASSQAGFALGAIRAGLPGAFAAWAAFTLPSALALMAFAGVLAVVGGAGEAGWLLGLKAAAVAVVAQACLGMGRGLAPDAARQTLAAAAAAATLLIPGVWGQLAAILAGGLIGVTLLRDVAMAPSGEDEPLPSPISRGAALGCIAAFFALLALLPLISGVSPLTAYADGFYRAGALVFGGGHVVLPLLEAETVGRGWVDADAFIAGYGAAQAVPGPLFTFAAYLGQAGAGVAGAAVALIAIFLPGMLLILGALPFWSTLRVYPQVRAALTGVNAAVVGVLLAALYDPVFLDGAGTPLGFVIAVGAFTALTTWKLSPLYVVGGAAALGAAASAVGFG